MGSSYNPHQYLHIIISSSSSPWCSHFLSKGFDGIACETPFRPRHHRLLPSSDTTSWTLPWPALINLKKCVQNISSCTGVWTQNTFPQKHVFIELIPIRYCIYRESLQGFPVKWQRDQIPPLLLPVVPNMFQCISVESRVSKRGV